MLQPKFVENDHHLALYKDTIVNRIQKSIKKEKILTGNKMSLKEFASGHEYFGLHKKEDHWIFREWAPNATEIIIVGEFSNWEIDNRNYLQNLGHGKWEIKLPLDLLKHNDLYHLIIRWQGGQGNRIPSYARRVVQDHNTLIFNAQVWDPKPYQWKCPDFVRKNEAPLIYEAHVGMSNEVGKVSTYEEFRINVLPRIIKAGYNTIQLMAIQEHPYYGSFGYHVSNYYAASSRFGTPEELKALIDDAHCAGIAVIMDIVHSHAVKNEVEGLSRFDGTLYQYFHDGPRGNHVAWDSRCFHYGKNEVLHFLLSNCQFWLDEYKFDGYRFDGITSMLYLDHGLGSDFLSYGQYFNLNQDEDAITYMWLANKLIHSKNPNYLTIAEEMSGMPGLATPMEDGGIGFDYRLAMGVPDFWIKTIKEVQDEHWHVGHLFFELKNKRQDEKTIHYAESHDQALVGDKTILFRLIDKDIYFDMHISHQNLNVDRGIALHKMIRLITIATAGGGYLNFMGNEFGHPEWIDFPREGNQWSYHYARRQWSLFDNADLRYKFLGKFDKDMIELIKKENCLQLSDPHMLKEKTDDQIAIFQRGELIFVFNFNPTKSFTDYGFETHSGKYKVVLDSDSKEYGGFERLDKNMVYSTPNNKKHRNELKLYIPSRSAFVLKQV